MLVLVSSVWLFVWRVGLLGAVPTPPDGNVSAPSAGDASAPPFDDAQAPVVVGASDASDVVPAPHADGASAPLVDAAPVVLFSRRSRRVGSLSRLMRRSSPSVLVIETGSIWTGAVECLGGTSRNEVIANVPRLVVVRRWCQYMQKVSIKITSQLRIMFLSGGVVDVVRLAVRAVAAQLLPFPSQACL